MTNNLYIISWFLVALGWIVTISFSIYNSNRADIYTKLKGFLSDLSCWRDEALEYSGKILEHKGDSSKKLNHFEVLGIKYSLIKGKYEKIIQSHIIHIETFIDIDFKDVDSLLKDSLEFFDEFDTKESFEKDFTSDINRKISKLNDIINKIDVLVWTNFYKAYPCLLITTFLSAELILTIRQIRPFLL
uniref:hypothetical protein n=1 Tax=Pseudoalteromonas aliena TaxID=247523 RepID=UPI002493D6AC